jgi:hypothetical protein
MSAPDPRERINVDLARRLLANRGSCCADAAQGPAEPRAKRLRSAAAEWEF